MVEPVRPPKMISFGHVSPRPQPPSLPSRLRQPQWPRGRPCLPKRTWRSRRPRPRWSPSTRLEVTKPGSSSRLSRHPTWPLLASLSTSVTTVRARRGPGHPLLPPRRTSPRPLFSSISYTGTTVTTRETQGCKRRGFTNPLSGHYLFAFITVESHRLER